MSQSQRIKLLPNPCRFSINDISFAVTSVDVLFHLRKEQLVLRAEEVESEEVDGQLPATDTMASLSRLILQQRWSVPFLPCQTLAHNRSGRIASIHCFRHPWTFPTKSTLTFLILNTLHCATKKR